MLSPVHQLGAGDHYSTGGRVGKFMGGGVDTFPLEVGVVFSDAPGGPRLCVFCTCVLVWSNKIALPFLGSLIKVSEGPCFRELLSAAWSYHIRWPSLLLTLSQLVISDRYTMLLPFTGQGTDYLWELLLAWTVPSSPLAFLQMTEAEFVLISWMTVSDSWAPVRIRSGHLCCIHGEHVVIMGCFSFHF